MAKRDSEGLFPSIRAESHALLYEHIHECLHKWACIWVPLTCNVILAWRVLRSNAARSRRSAHSQPRLTELLAAWTGGSTESQTNHVTLRWASRHAAAGPHGGYAVPQYHVVARRSRLITALKIWQDMRSALECVSGLRQQQFSLLTPRSSDPLLSADYPFSLVLIVKMLPHCTYIFFFIWNSNNVVSLLFIWKCIIKLPSRYKGLICEKVDWL